MAQLPPKAAPETDYVVLQFTCADSGSVPSLPDGFQEMTWKIMVGSTASMQPVEVKVVVGNLNSSPQVGVVINKEQKFPASPFAGSVGLEDDFRWELPFEGAIEGLRRPGFHEMRPPSGDPLQWYSCTVIDTRQDGDFAVLAFLPDGERVAYPRVMPSHVRKAGSREAVEVRKRALTLHVPKDRPEAITLYVDGEPITTAFGRPTPPVQSPSSSSSAGKAAGAATSVEGDQSHVAKVDARLARPVVVFSVSKDRKTVSCQESPCVLRRFLADEVSRRCSDTASASSRHRKQWTLQVGPFATHTVELRRRNPQSHSLIIDGDVFVEGKPEDIQSPERNVWTCKFRLLGRKVIDWEVFECDHYFSQLDTRGTVSEKMLYAKECVVHANLSKDVAEATLAIDGVDFEELLMEPEGSSPESKEHVELTPKVLRARYGISVPFKVADSDASSSLCNMFHCCGKPKTAPDSDVLLRPSHQDKAASSMSGPPDFMCNPAGALLADDAVSGQAIPQLPEPTGWLSSNTRAQDHNQAQHSDMLAPVADTGRHSPKAQIEAEVTADETDDQSRSKASKPAKEKGSEGKCCSVQ